ncbi:hypothetical protein I4U23_028603 [Adineta vaga]|nr:hypothetical protein I4U23_028603 [Adineta vaga]
MSFLTQIFVIGILMTNGIAEGIRHDKMKNDDYSKVKRIYQLLRRLELSSDNQLFFQTRVEREGDCTADLLEGYSWTGTQIISRYGIDGTQMCMDLCETSKECTGWSYNPSFKFCWGLKEINGILEDRNVRSGPCIGSTMKVKCTENQPGQYLGYGSGVVYDVATAEDCMTKCDESNVCYGWAHTGDSDRTCYLMRSFDSLDGTLTSSSTGRCIAPQQHRHNLKRQKHCVPPLTLDSQLNDIAQMHADKFAIADEIPPKYDTKQMISAYYQQYDEYLHGGIPVDLLYNEHKVYKYDKPDFKFASHFAKIIWKSSTKMGVGRAVTKSKDSTTVFVVIFYVWSGDMAKAARENMFPTCE